MLEEANRRCGVKWNLTQGSYSPSEDPTSQGSHDGGGVFDFDGRHLSATQRRNSLIALREVGFAAWFRTTDQGPWTFNHVHAVAISDTDLAPVARKQVGSYYEGRIGLKKNVADDGPQVKKVTWEDYQRAH